MPTGPNLDRAGFCKDQVNGSSPLVNLIKEKKMKINLWYCKEMKMWRWTLMDDRDST